MEEGNSANRAQAVAMKHGLFSRLGAWFSNTRINIFVIRQLTVHQGGAGLTGVRSIADRAVVVPFPRERQRLEINLASPRRLESGNPRGAGWKQTISELNKGIKK